MSKEESGEEPSESEGDLSFNVHRLFDSKEVDDDARMTAATALCRVELPDELFPRFLAAYDEVSHLGLKSTIGTILMSQWPTRKEVQELAERLIRAPDTSSDTLRPFLAHLSFNLRNNAKLAADEGIQNVIRTTHHLVTRMEKTTDGLVADWGYALLHDWSLARYAHALGNDEVPIHFLISASAASLDDSEMSAALHGVLSFVTHEQHEKWVRCARLVYEAHINTKTHMAEEALVIWALLENRSITSICDELGYDNPEADFDERLDSILLPGDSEEIFEENVNTIVGEFFGGLLRGRTGPPVFSLEEERELASAIQENPQSPTSLLLEAVQQYPYVFLELISENGTQRFPNTVFDLEQQAHLSHIAIDIAPEHAKYFEEFCINGDCPELGQALYGDDDGDWKSFRERYADAMSKLRSIPGIEWAYIGAPSNVSGAGEIALDAHVGHLAAIRKKHPRAKTLILSLPYLEFSFSVGHCNAVAHDQDVTLSIPQRLREEGGVGSDCTASLFAPDIDSRFDGDVDYEDGNEIIAFCERHSIARSFALKPAGTPLGKVSFFGNSFITTYEEAFGNGVLVYHPGDDNDDRDPFSRDPVPGAGKSADVDEEARTLSEKI